MYIISFMLVVIINSLALAQNYGSWYEVDSMDIARVGHSMVVLPNGDVLVSGSEADSIQSSCEIYEFSTGKWRYTTPMIVPRALHSFVLLSSGKVLAIGGLFERSCEIFDPQTETWTMTDSIIVARNWGGFTTTTLKDNRILVVGGLSQDSIGAPFMVLDDCEIFDPVIEKWATVSSMILGRYNLSATLLNDGRLLVAGGETDMLTTNQCEIYDPSTNIWTNVASMNESRSRHAAILLKSGNVFLSGGGNEDPLIISCEIFDLNLNQWSFVDDMLMYRIDHKIYYLPKVDKLLIVGGGTINFGEDTWEIYDPNLLQPDYVEPFPINQLLEYNNIQLQNENIFVCGGWEYFFNPMPVFYSSYRSWIFDITTGVNKDNELSKNYKLSQNYPNPFNPQTTISYELPSAATVKLVIYDNLGREVETLVDQVQSSGSYNINFNANDLSSGIYYYRLIIKETEKSNGNTFQKTNKMILLR